ncbi:MAG: MFS transporter, partial [Syntrophomonas sp.]
MMKTEKKSIVFFILMLGIFMGAIDSGIVSPAREIIQNSLGTGATTGIWMITIYNLFYAISMPIVSKLADRNGHKSVFVIGVGLFGLGSLLCGLSNFYGSFAWLLAARVIQAIGAGGIIPIATTYIGQSFPEEKRGTALGMVGAVFGVATIVGPSLGSGILGLAGNNHWGWIFFINVPISLIIIILSKYMQNIQVEKKQAMDLVGALTIAAVIASLLYGLTNLDFFQLGSSLQDRKVYPFLLAFILLMPILITVEKRAVDPILHIKYFKNQKMILVFIIAFITGVGMMGTVFIPQFAENVLKI